MKTKHTKGEWEFSKSEDGFIYIYSKKFGGICLILPYPDHLKNEMNSNAKLIAAAPELLKVCWNIYEQDTHEDFLNDYNLRDLEKAIEKATE